LRPELPEYVPQPELRARPLQRIPDVPPQPDGVVVGGVDGHPGEIPVLAGVGAPLSYQDALAKTGWSLDQNEFRRAPGETLEEFRPFYPLLTGAGRMKFRLNKHAIIHKDPP
jgi:hypothetical protein